MELQMLVPLILVCVNVLIKEVSVLIAFDCQNTNNNLSVVSIHDVAACPDEKKGYYEKTVSATVIQRNEFKQQKVIACLIEVTRTIQHCGMHSHTSAVSGGLSAFIKFIGKRECQNVHRHGSIQIFNRAIGRIAQNGTTEASLTIMGSLKDDGSCDGTAYSENGHSWSNVIVVVALKIHIRDYLATIKLNENEISLINGITCNYVDGYCMDSTFGETAWDYSPETSCDGGLTTLYNGKAEIITNINQPTEQILVVEQGDKIFALSLIKTIVLCGYDIWQSEHPKIVVTLNNNASAIKPKMNLIPQNTDMFSYINSKMLYIEQAYKRTTSQLYTSTVHRRCLLHREIIKNRLLIAPLSPNALSTIIKNKMGHVGRVLGEVLYIMQCTPKLVQIRRTNNCYQELPIVVNNQSKFMSPITHLIQEHAEQVECNALTPPLYYIDGKWIGLTPLPLEKNPPQLLGVEPEDNLKFKSIQPLGISGLYTQEEISKVQRTLNFGIERAAVETMLTFKLNGINNTDNQGYTTIHLFDGTEIKKLARNTLQYIWGWFTDIGMFMSGVIGFYVIFKALKYFLNVILNGLAIYKTVGCGFILLASIWNTLAVWLVHRHQSQQKQNDDIEAQNVLKCDPKLTASAPNLDTAQSTTTLAATTYPHLDEWTASMTSPTV